jgi:histidine triad (HIT) family protein
MGSCIFCRILTGQSPASVVHQDEICTAFMDIQPVNPGHVLVVPNDHAPDLADLSPDTGAHLFKVGQRVAGALYASGLPCDGVNFFLADGEAAGQEVFHVHLHVFPRYEKDGFSFRFRPGYFELPARSELDTAAQKIQEHL